MGTRTGPRRCKTCLHQWRFVERLQMGLPAADGTVRVLTVHQCQCCTDVLELGGDWHQGQQRLRQLFAGIWGEASYEPVPMKSPTTTTRRR
jgi:hypothetical protein